jgi:hypothetical protein
LAADSQNRRRLGFSQPGAQLSPDTLSDAAPLKEILPGGNGATVTDLTVFFHIAPLSANRDRRERHLRRAPDCSDASPAGRDLHDRATGEASDLAFVVVIVTGEIHLVPTTETVDFHLIPLFSLPSPTTRNDGVEPLVFPKRVVEDRAVLQVHSGMAQENNVPSQPHHRFRQNPHDCVLSDSSCSERPPTGAGSE